MTTSLSTTYNIPFTNLGRCFTNHKHNLLKIFEEVGSTGQYVNGPHVRQFEETCADIAHRKYAVSVANATDGLYLTLLSMDIGVHDEVLVPAYSYFATAEAIAKTGAKPVFVDVDDHYHLNLKKAESLITPNTVGIIIVNLFGDMINLNELTVFADHYSLFVIEDAAQSFLSEFQNIPSGNIGIASVYSFAPSKQVPGIGHGGCVITDSATIYHQLTTLKLHGKSSNRHEVLGYNSIMSEFEAAFLNYFLALRETILKKRTIIAEQYLSAIKETAFHPPLIRDSAIHSWHKFVLRYDDRDALLTHLASAGIQTQIHYGTLPPHELAFSSKIKFHNAERLSNISISIPIYPELIQDEIQYVITHLHTFS